MEDLWNVAFFRTIEEVAAETPVVCIPFFGTPDEVRELVMEYANAMNFRYTNAFWGF
jgi:hypothetical protein